MVHNLCPSPVFGANHIGIYNAGSSVPLWNKAECERCRGAIIIPNLKPGGLVASL